MSVAWRPFPRSDQKKLSDFTSDNSGYDHSSAAFVSIICNENEKKVDLTNMFVLLLTSASLR